MENASDLILLMGTNPLPNYVAFKCVKTVNPNLHRLWIVHSEDRPEQSFVGTKELAEVLKDTLRDEGETIEINLVPLRDISSARRIQEDLENRLLTHLKGPNQLYHLNYTGGTKAMAVHTYRKLEAELKERCSFSYLDARDFALKDDQAGVLTGDLRNEIQVDLETLMRIHDYEKGISTPAPDWPEVLDKMARIIEEKALVDYLDWVRTFLNSHYFRRHPFRGLAFIERQKDFWKENRLVDNDGRIIPEKADEFQEEFRSITPPRVLELLQLIPSEHAPLEGDKWWIPRPNTSSNREYHERAEVPIKGFLHGKWLESYVCRVLRDNLQELPTGTRRKVSVDKNWRILKRSNRQDGKDFELDVIIVYGYQVTGISVTTAVLEGICKQKGFEVMHRVNQIGGDEGKAILVTCLDDSKKHRLEDDLQIISGSPLGKIKVLGIEDLPEQRLWQEIRKFIWG